MIRIKGVPVTVIGVLARKGQNSQGQDQDDIVFVPISTFRNRVQGGSLGNVKRIWSDQRESALREGQSMALHQEENINDPAAPALQGAHPM